MPDIERFLAAQNEQSGSNPALTVYQQAELEIANGYKRTHWVWFIFPQLASLGRSPKALWYGIADEDEAKEYMQHPDLYARYVHMVSLVFSHVEHGVELEDILGEIDAKKFRSSLALFAPYL